MVHSLCAQDHVVLLLSPQDFEHPPLWLSENFNILEGGVHAGWFIACSLASATAYSIHRLGELEQAHRLRRRDLSRTLLLDRYSARVSRVEQKISRSDRFRIDFIASIDSQIIAQRCRISTGR